MLFLNSFKRYKNNTSLTKSVDCCLYSLRSDQQSCSSFGNRHLSSFASIWGLRSSWKQKSPALSFKVSASQSLYPSGKDVSGSNLDLSLAPSNRDIPKKCFWNQTFDKGRLKNFVLWFFLKYGEHKTVRLVEELKTIGFQYATKAGISLGVEDLKIPPKKAALINEAERLSIATIQQFKRGEITEVERFQRLIDTWHRTSEQLKVEVIENFEGTDVLNPVYMMAFSGARGNISQVRQLVGMRGLMSNPQGQIIDYPIRSNFREGLTLTEYIISSYGARKGIVDTALRTANAGYLTRRLVDVAQHVIISSTDCGTTRGIFLNDMKEGNKTIYSLQNRLVGRVLARDIYSQGSSTSNKRIKIASKNTEISSDLATLISQHHKKVFVRSPLTCQTNKLVCQLCYGWSLAQGNLVSIGEAVGIVAAQSIGEPGTQLTMRTFHTGGVFAGNISEQIKAPFDGFVIYKNPIAGKLIRTPEGKIAFLTKDEGSFSVYRLPTNIPLNKSLLNSQAKRDDKGSDIVTGDTGDRKNVVFQNFSPKLTKLDTLEKRNFKIPFYTLLFLRNGEKAFYKQVIAQITSINRQKTATDQAEFTIKAEISGLFYSKNLEIEETKVGPIIKDNQAEAMSEEEKESLLDTINRAWSWGYAWILAGRIYQLPLPSSFFPILGDFVNKTSLMNCVNWYMPNSFGSGFKLNRPLNFSLFNTNSFKLMRRSSFGGIGWGNSERIVKQSLNSQASHDYLARRAEPILSLKGKDLTLGLSRLNKVSKAHIDIASVLSSSTNRAKVSNTSLIEKDFKLLKYDLISFELSKMTYKNIGYFLKLSKPSCLGSKPKPETWLTGSNKITGLQEQSLIKSSQIFGPSSSKIELSGKTSNLNHNAFFNNVCSQTSILSHQDNLFLFSSLFPRNRFFNTVKTNKSLQTNTRNPLINPSTWEPSFNVFLNWFPKRFFTPTGGLIFFDTNSSKVTVNTHKVSTDQQQKSSLTVLPFFMSFVWPSKNLFLCRLCPKGIDTERRTNQKSFYSLCSQSSKSINITSQQMSISFETRRNPMSTFIVSKNSLHCLSLDSALNQSKCQKNFVTSGKHVVSSTITSNKIVKMPSIYIDRNLFFAPETQKIFGFPTFLSISSGHRRSKKESLEQSNKIYGGTKPRATRIMLNKSNNIGQSPSLLRSQQGSQVIDPLESIAGGHTRSITVPELHSDHQGDIITQSVSIKHGSQSDTTFKKNLNKNLELNSLLQTFIYEQYPKNLLGYVDGQKSLSPEGIAGQQSYQLGQSTKHVTTITSMLEGYRHFNGTKIVSEGAKNIGLSWVYSWKKGFKFQWGLNLICPEAAYNKRNKKLSKTGLMEQQSSPVISSIKQRAFWVPQPFYKIRDKNNSTLLVNAEQGMQSFCLSGKDKPLPYKGLDKSRSSEHLVIVQSNRQGKTRLIELNGNCAQLIVINNKVNGVCLNSKAKKIIHNSQSSCLCLCLSDKGVTTSIGSVFENSSISAEHYHLSNVVNFETKVFAQKAKTASLLFKKEAFYKLPTNFGISLEAQQEPSLFKGQRRSLVKRKMNFVMHGLPKSQIKHITLKAYCKQTSMIRRFVTDGLYFLPKKLQTAMLQKKTQNVFYSSSAFTNKKQSAFNTQRALTKSTYLFDLYCYSLFYKLFKRKNNLNLISGQSKNYSNLYSKQVSTQNGIKKASHLLFPFLCSPYLQNQFSVVLQQLGQSPSWQQRYPAMLHLDPKGIDSKAYKQKREQIINNFCYLGLCPPSVNFTLNGIFKTSVKREMFQRLKTVQKAYKKALFMVTCLYSSRKDVTMLFGLEKQNKKSNKMSVSKSNNNLQHYLYPKGIDVATFKNKKTSHLGSKGRKTTKTLSQLLKMDKASLLLEKTRLLKGKTKTEQEKVNNVTSIPIFKNEPRVPIQSLSKDHSLFEALTKQKKKKSLKNLLVDSYLKTGSEQETNINLWLTNGYFYYTTDLSKFFLYNKKIIQPGTNIDLHFSFDKNPVYLEIIPLKTDHLGISTSCQQKGLVTNLLLETKFSTSSANPYFLSKKSEQPSTAEENSSKVIQGYDFAQKAKTQIAFNKKLVIKEQEWLKSFQKDNKITIIKENNPTLDDKSQSKKIIELDISQTLFNKNCRFKIEKTQLNKVTSIPEGHNHSQTQSSLTPNLMVPSMSGEHRPTNYIILIRKAFEYQFVKEIEYKKDIYSLRLGQNPSWQECYPGYVNAQNALSISKVNKIAQNRAKQFKINTMAPSMSFGQKEDQKAYLILQSRKLKRKMLNQSFHSIHLYLNYKTSLLNKQKTTGQLISKNGSSQLKLIFNNNLYLKKSMPEGHRLLGYIKEASPQQSQNDKHAQKISTEVRDITKFDSKGIDFNQKPTAAKQTQTRILKQRNTNNFTILKNDTQFAKARSLGNPSLIMTSLKSLNLSPFIISYKAPYSINFPFKMPMCFFSQQYQPSFILNNPWAIGNNAASMNIDRRDSKSVTSTKMDKSFDSSLANWQRQITTQKRRNKILKSREYSTLKQLLSNYISKINNHFSKGFMTAMPFNGNRFTVGKNKNYKPNLFEIGKSFSNLSSIFVSPIVEYSLINEFPKSIPGSLFEKPTIPNQQSFSKQMSPLDIQTSAILNNRYLRKQNLLLNNSNNKKFLFGKNGPLLGSLASGSPTSNNSFSRFTQTNEELISTIKKALYKIDFVSYIDNSVNSQIPIIKTYAYSSLKGELIYQKKPLKKMIFEPSVDSEDKSKQFYNLLSIPEENSCLSAGSVTSKQQLSRLHPKGIDKGIDTFSSSLGLRLYPEGSDVTKKGTTSQQLPSITTNKLIRQRFTDFFLSTKPVDHVEHGCMVLTKNDQVCYNLSPLRQHDVFSGKQIKPFNQNYKEIYHSLENQKIENQYFINNIVINLLNLLITETNLEAKPLQSNGDSSTLEDQKQKVDKISKTEESPYSSKYPIDELFSGFLTTELTNNITESMSEGDKTNLAAENELNLKTTKSMLAKSGTLELNKIPAGLAQQRSKLLIGEFLVYGDKINPAFAITKSGQIIHVNNSKVTLRKGQPIFVSPQAILHKYDGDFIDEQTSVITLAYQQLKTGDIVQGIPKIEQFFEARTTKRGRLFRDSLENLLKAIFNRYNTKLPRDQAVRQSFYKIQQIIIDGVQRVYRSQGVTIADKHLEVIVKQMTSKVRITFGGTTGYLPGELCDLYDIELINKDIRPKILYEPIVLGITKASLEVKSFLSAASFQQTTRVLTKAALSRKTDYLNGLKENVILGNLIPAGTGYLVYLDKYSTNL